jgi:hypothetical protein
LPQLGSTVDPLAALSVIREICIEVERLHPDLGYLGVRIPSAVPQEVTRLAALAEEVIRRGDLPTRGYR